MSLPESDPNESVEISGADFAIMCDEIDSLKKQVSRLEIEAEETAYLRIRVDRLKAELAEAKRDAARYRWLRGGNNLSPISDRYRRWEVKYWTGVWWESLLAETLDAAIDASMEVTK